MRALPKNSIDLPSNVPGKDAVSSVLSLLEPRAQFSGRIDTGGSWALSFPSLPGLKFCEVVRGKCSLIVDGESTPLSLESNDCFLLTRDVPFRLTTDTSLEPTDVRAVYATTKGATAIHRPSRHTKLTSTLFGGRFEFDLNQDSILISLLSPVIHIRAKSKEAEIVSWIAERLMEELSTPGLGADLSIEHLGQMLLIQSLRANPGLGEERRVGWFGALADPKVGPTLNRIHANPGHRWTVQHLAESAAMSQSSFCSLFKERTGLAPLAYVLHWRMQLAMKALRLRNLSIAQIAFASGYRSESAFGNAFKRVVGKAPRRYQREMRASQIAH